MHGRVPVAILVLIDIILYNGLPPGRPALELIVVDVDARIDDVDVDALSPTGVVLVLPVRAERELVSVADTRQTLR